ncbi:hypothetical protein EDD22DRAFT_938767 [Suillus occidentalis]|nr:hypothetical protein EDD22DRAFT_938767 [Suillus occidentalis]
MLTLSPGSVCDVCAEEYNLHCVPLSIPCGHIFCWSCCHKIVQKTLPRLQAACPFCSDHFISDDVRLIRINLSEIGQVSPRWREGLTEALDRSPEDRFPLVEPSFSHARAEARRLEDKVAKVATRTCSFEEVSTLYKELEEWLTHDDNFHVKSNSLSSSAGLLRIILMNHMAHSGATRKARGLEATLKAKLDDMESKVSKLESDQGRYQALYFQKVQECQALRAELARYPSTSFRATDLPARPSTAAPTSLSEHRRRVSSSAAPTYNVPPMPSMLSRFTATHSQSASASASGSRPTTPARMTTPSVRSQTSTQGSVPSSRLRAPSPILPSRPRTIPLSATAPQKLTRSRSDDQERERERIHERRMPSPNKPPTGKTTNYPPYLGSSPAPSGARPSLSAATLPRIIITPTQSDEDVSGPDDDWELGEDGWELDEDELEPDEDESELDEDGSEIDEDGPELDENGSDIDEDGSEIYEDELEPKPIYERWMPPPDSMADPPIGQPINYPPYFTPFPLPGRARASLSTNSATRLPQTATPVQQDENMWERGRMHSMPSQPSNISTGNTANHPSYSHPPFLTYAAAVPPQTIPPVHPDQHERGRKRTHERWMPSQNVASNPPTGKNVNCPPYFGSFSAPGRTGF